MCNYRDYLTYEPDTGHLYWKVSRGMSKVGKRAGYITNSGYRSIGIKQKYYPAHHIVWWFEYGYMPKLLDHVDRNRDNNKITNLRLASHTENMRNRKLQKNNTSGARGVSFKRGKYEACIRTDEGRKYLGRFETLIEAKEVYDKAAKKYHKEFCYVG